MIRFVKCLLTLIFCINTLNVVGQNDTSSHTIEWKKPTSLVINNTYKNILTFKGADHRIDYGYLPVFTVSFNNIYAAKFDFTDVVWENLTANDILNLPEKYDIASEPFFKVFNPIERKNYGTVIDIIPLRRNSSGILEKMTKFEIKIFPIDPPSITGNITNQYRINAVSTSILSQGDWYKFPVTASGIYKIDYNYLKAVGIKPEEINTRHLQLWGNPGGMLPESNLALRPDDLNQIPIYVSDGNDNKFDLNDYILLYVTGPDVWKQSSSKPYFTYFKNIYSSTSFYFLTIGSSDGKRIVPEGEISQSADFQSGTYTNRVHHEIDNINFLTSGRGWFGEDFDNGSQTFNFPLNAIVPGSEVAVTSAFMNKSPQSALGNNFSLSINNTPFKSYTLYGGGDNLYDVIGSRETNTDYISSDNFIGSKNLTLSISYSKNSGIGKGYLDFFTLIFEDALVQNSNYQDFRNVNNPKSGIGQYNIQSSGGSQMRVWNVSELSEISEPLAQTFNNITSFKYAADSVFSEFVAFYGNSFPAPGKGSKISNQNLHASITPNLLIITHPDFKSQADKLADFRREHDNLEVIVATTEEIYNEFSSGAQDLVALRDFARMFYKRSDFSKFNYLLLFGDCSYDYKNNRGISNPQSLVPVYESEESLMPTATYSSDDYVGLLDDAEGDWTNEKDIMDIGIGRIPVNTIDQAETIVQKLMHYTVDPNTLGAWRQNLTFIADNEEGNKFLENAEYLSDLSDRIQNSFNTKKIYLASYPHEQGFTPQANLDIANEFENGTLIMNYIGHGGEGQLASENIINIGTISGLNNINRLPFMVTATCDFGRYDEPSISSGGERLLLSPKGGAIGLLCTTRPVYQNNNELINDAFYKSVFSKKGGNYLRLGELIRQSKNKSTSGVFNRNFALLGDPSLKLAYPENNITITSINGKPYIPFADTLKAQSKVTIGGNIVSGNSTMTNFNGVVNTLVFDKTSKISTIEEPKVSYDIRNSKIFDGSASVKDGAFSFTFIVPRNINYIVGSGKLSLYANVENGSMVDAGGGDSEILIGGGDQNVTKEQIPPQVKAYLNDESFVQGSITNETPLLVVKLFDENGISSIGDIGGSISVIVNNNNKDEKVLDSYYKSDRDTYKSGTINYRLSNLNNGANTLKIKAFDTSKNPGSVILDFNVAKHESLTIKNLLNYPNPFTTSTVFHFDHNRAGDDLEIMLQIYTVTGKLIKSITNHTTYASTHISDMVWDGKDEYGDNIGRGVYVYKLSVKALSDGFKKDEFQKLVILN